MTNTLIIYEGKYGTAQQVAHNVGAIIGNCKVLPIDKAPDALGAFQNVVIVFSFRGYDTLTKTREYLKKMQAPLKEKQMAAVGVGLSIGDLKAYMQIINERIEVKEENTYFLQGELRVKELNREDYKVLQAFTKKVNIPFQDMGNLNLSKVAEVGEKLKAQLQLYEKPMPKQALKQEIEHFVGQHNMLALATGRGEDIRCSPVEFIYNEDCFYIITEGGLKFRGLTQNNKVSFGIYDAYEGMGKLGGLQVTATAEMVPVLSAEYIKIMGIRGITVETVQKLPIDLYMVKLIPCKYEFLYSPLAKEGYGTKQCLEVVL